MTNEERLWLYQNCAALAFPSKTEGFGLPVIEAMAFGRPVFVSPVTSLPEIGGNLAFYWNDHSPTEMANVVRKGFATFEADPTYSTQLQTWAAKFSWENAANSYLSLYQEVHSAALTRAA